jgi:predicted N-formylglutamate amidohydrolase
MRCLISCEHASNRVPKPYAFLFQGQEKFLNTHRAYDLGAAKFARKLAAELQVPAYLGAITRLLVDLNRSPANKKALFTQYSRKLAQVDRELLLQKYYQPYRARVEKAIGEIIAEEKPVLHISVHTFTPVKNGRERTADIGLLYDPAREAEKEICTFLVNLLKREVATVQVRRNYPYLGKTDGFNSFLRRKYPAKVYTGIEIEMNQAFLFKNDFRKKKTIKVVAEGIRGILRAGEL